MIIKNTSCLSILVFMMSLLIALPANAQSVNSLTIAGDGTLPGTITEYSTTSELSWISHIFPGNENGFMWSMEGGTDGGILFNHAQDISVMMTVRAMFDQPTTFFSIGTGISIDESNTIDMANLRMWHGGVIIDVGSGSGFNTLIPVVNDVTLLAAGENGWMTNQNGSYHLIYNTKGTCLDCNLKLHLTGTSVLNAALSNRGNGMIYDEILDITWIADAGLARNDIGENVDWWSATLWASNLVYGGYSDWRLPSMDVNGDGVIINCMPPTAEHECRDNEYDYLFNRHGIRVAAPGDFINIGALHYWSGTENPVFPSLAYLLNFDTGFRGTTSKITINRNAWAVRDGDVAILRCDLNGNGEVDAGDLSQVVRMVLGNKTADLGCDLNNGGLGDGVISAADLVIVSRIALGIIPAIYN